MRALFRRHSHGFTLVELAIVLVIVGLVVGGILVGQHLMDAARLQSVISDIKRYETAADVFFMKYSALPGDTQTATENWGVSTHGCPIPANSAHAAGTCNGNGDGELFPSSGNVEMFLFWQHMSLAGLIGGNYTGASASAIGITSTSAVGINVPRASDVPDWMYKLQTLVNDQTGHAANFDRARGVELMIAPSNGTLNVPVFTAQEAKTMDIKIDDGMPAKGAW